MQYVAFLRGINVGGNKRVNMADLKKMCEDMGFAHVKTYINSGNVIFETDNKSSETLTKEIEEQIQKTFGFEVKVMVRTIDTLEKILKENPFNHASEEEKVYISFLYNKPTPDEIKSIEALGNNIYTFKVKDKELYMLRKPDNDPLLSAKEFKEKNLGGIATNRNINTVRKIITL